MTVLIGSGTAPGAFCAADVDDNGILGINVSARLALAEREQSLSMGG